MTSQQGGRCLNKTAFKPALNDEKCADANASLSRLLGRVKAVIHQSRLMLKRIFVWHRPRLDERSNLVTSRSTQARARARDCKQGTRLTHAAVAKHGGVKPEALAHLHAARKEAVAVGTHAVHASDATTAKPPKHAHTEASKSYGSSKERSRVLARFKLKEGVCISVFKVQTKEDISSVAWLTPENRQMPQREKGVSLIARMEVNPAVGIQERLALASARGMSMDDAVGPAVGVLTATYGTSTISCVYDFDIPEEVEQCVVEGRIELWGLNIPRTAKRPASSQADSGAHNSDAARGQIIEWTTRDRLNISRGMIYALCIDATGFNISCGFAAPRLSLLKHWQSAGIRMKEITTPIQLVYPSHAADFEYYASATVAFFLADQVRDGLHRRLELLE